MNNPQIFRLSSRLGMLNPPWKGNTLNDGVEMGPQAVHEALKTIGFSDENTKSFYYPLPHQIDPKNVFTVIADQSYVYSNEMSKSLSGGHSIVCIGGDHSISIAPFHAALSHYGAGNVGIIRIDSHPDILTRKTSTTGNIHGMWMRMFLDEFDDVSFAKLAANVRVEAHQVLYIGNLDSEPEEVDFISKQWICTYSRDDVLEVESQQKILKWTEPFDRLILDIDIDAFDKSVAPGTGIPAVHGLMEDDISFLRPLRQKICVLNMVEVNPHRDQHGQTARLAATLIGLFLP